MPLPDERASDAASDAPSVGAPDGGRPDADRPDDDRPDDDRPDVSSDLAAPDGLSPKLEPLFREATDIADRSPAASCAMLRMLLRMLIRHAGGRGRHLKNDLTELVDKGAPVGLLRAMDVAAISEAEARQPAEINLANGHSDVRNLMVLVHVFVNHVGGGPAA